MTKQPPNLTITRPPERAWNETLARLSGPQGLYAQLCADGRHPHKPELNAERAAQAHATVDQMARLAPAKVTATALAQKYHVLALVTAGPHTGWQKQAHKVMTMISWLGAQDKNFSAQILSGDAAVFQLARNGQADAVWREIKSMNPAQRAQVLAADESLFGLLQYGNTGDVIAAFDKMEPALRFAIVRNQPEDHPAAQRNERLLDIYRQRILIEQAQEEAALAAERAPEAAIA